MPLSYSAPAIKFGDKLAKNFKAIYTTSKWPDEIAQFNALIKCFKSGPKGFNAT